LNEDESIASFLLLFGRGGAGGRDGVQEKQFSLVRRDRLTQKLSKQRPDVHIEVRRVGIGALSRVAPLPATPLRGLRRPLLGQGEVRISDRRNSWIGGSTVCARLRLNELGFVRCRVAPLPATPLRGFTPTSPRTRRGQNLGQKKSMDRRLDGLR
jgi:hypothetical protein